MTDERNVLTFVHGLCLHEVEANEDASVADVTRSDDASDYLAIDADLEAIQRVRPLALVVCDGKRIWMYRDRFWQTARVRATAVDVLVALEDDHPELAPADEEDSPENRACQHEAPAPQLIRSAREAEAVARDWLAFWGATGARLTRHGPDGGIDIESDELVAQVKAQVAPVTAHMLQAIHGVAAVERKRAVFFALGAYTTDALRWAERAQLALFRFDLSGHVPEPANAWARQVMLGPREGSPVERPPTAIDEAETADVWRRSCRLELDPPRIVVPDIVTVFDWLERSAVLTGTVEDGPRVRLTWGDPSDWWHVDVKWMSWNVYDLVVWGDPIAAHRRLARLRLEDEGRPLAEQVSWIRQQAGWAPEEHRRVHLHAARGYYLDDAAGLLDRLLRQLELFVDDAIARLG